MSKRQKLRYLVSRAAFHDEGPAHNIIVDTFLMDKYEVSNKKYAEFIMDFPIFKNHSFSRCEYVSLLSLPRCLRLTILDCTAGRRSVLPILRARHPRALLAHVEGWSCTHHSRRSFRGDVAIGTERIPGEQGHYGFA